MGGVTENLEAFFKRYPLSKDRILKVAESNNQKNYRIEEDSDGIHFYEKDILIDSTVKDFLPSLELRSSASRFVFVNGFGLGALLQNVLQSASSEADEFVIVEPSIERFLFSLSQTQLKNLIEHPKFHWIVGLERSELAREFFVLLSNRERLQKAKAYQFHTHPVIDALHPGYFEHLKVYWEMSLEMKKKSWGFLSDSLEGLKNTIVNLSWLEQTPGIHPLKGKFSDVPAVIVSTGPSLRKSLSELKLLQDKALLLTADASLKILIENGIHPHFVFCLERDEGSKPFFTDIPKEKAKAELVVFPLVPSTVIQAYQGPHWAVYRQYGYYQFLEQESPKGFLKCGPSVAHMAVAFANFVGCKEAFLVGQDLAYDPETFSSHPPGIAYSEWSKPSSEQALRKKLEASGDELVWTPGNLHEKVPTSGYYEIFRLNFGESLGELSLKLTNCTEGGAKIPSIEWKKLSDAAKHFSKQNSLWERIQDCRKNSHASSKIDLSKMKNLLANFTSAIENAPDLEKLHFEIQKNPLFIAFVVEFLGKDLIDLEWKFFESDRNKALKDWHSAIISTLKSVLKLLN